MVAGLARSKNNVSPAWLITPTTGDLWPVTSRKLSSCSGATGCSTVRLDGWTQPVTVRQIKSAVSRRWNHVMEDPRRLSDPGKIPSRRLEARAFSDGSYGLGLERCPSSDSAIERQRQRYPDTGSALEPGADGHGGGRPISPDLDPLAVVDHVSDDSPDCGPCYSGDNHGAYVL